MNQMVYPRRNYFICSNQKINYASHNKLIVDVVVLFSMYNRRQYFMSILINS